VEPEYASLSSVSLPLPTKVRGPGGRCCDLTDIDTLVTGRAREAQQLGLPRHPSGIHRLRTRAPAPPLGRDRARAVPEDYAGAAIGVVRGCRDFAGASVPGMDVLADRLAARTLEPVAIRQAATRRRSVSTSSPSTRSSVPTTRAGSLSPAQRRGAAGGTGRTLRHGSCPGACGARPSGASFTVSARAT
jgi:hypothetical protein